MRKVQKTGVPCFCGTPVLHHSTENYFMIFTFLPCPLFFNNF